MKSQLNKPNLALIAAKEHEKELTNSRLNKRIYRFICTVNNELNNIGTFAVSTSDRNQMINDVLTFISNYNGGENGKKYKDPNVCHIKVVRLWWNRVKSKKLGQYVFGPLIQLLFEFIDATSSSGLNKTKYFIHLLMVLFKTTIKYPKSKARPLIPIQIFVTKNKFRDFCEKFVCDCGEKKWKFNKMINLSAKNPKRSANLSESYIALLISILDKLEKVKIETNETSMHIDTEASSASFGDNHANQHEYASVNRTNNTINIKAQLTIPIPMNANHIINININAHNINGHGNGNYIRPNIHSQPYMQPLNHMHPNNNPAIPPFPRLRDMYFQNQSNQILNDTLQRRQNIQTTDHFPNPTNNCMVNNIHNQNVNFGNNNYNQQYRPSNNICNCNSQYQYVNNQGNQCLSYAQFNNHFNSQSGQCFTCC